MKAGNRKPAPLYRRVNTRTHGVAHGSRTAARDERGTKKGGSASMHSGQLHGLDYSPLYKFLLSKVGQRWADIHQKLQGRLPSDDAIYHLLARHANDADDIVRIGESSFYSSLTVDEDGTLQRINPDLALEHLHPTCACCTFTFNGDRFVHPWDGDATMVRIK